MNRLIRTYKPSQRRRINAVLGRRGLRESSFSMGLSLEKEYHNCKEVSSPNTTSNRRYRNSLPITSSHPKARISRSSGSTSPAGSKNSSIVPLWTVLLQCFNHKVMDSKTSLLKMSKTTSKTFTSSSKPRYQIIISIKRLLLSWMAATSSLKAQT